MDEQNKKNATELQDEQMEEITGGAFSGSASDSFNPRQPHKQYYKCTYPAATSQYESVFLQGRPLAAKKCPYSTTPFKLCYYWDKSRKFAFKCTYLNL